jgi:hypothetical protein
MDLARGILFHKILNVMSFLFHEPLASTSSMVEHISNSVAAMYPGRAIERRALSQSLASLPRQNGSPAKRRSQSDARSGTQENRFPDGCPRRRKMAVSASRRGEVVNVAALHVAWTW